MSEPRRFSLVKPTLQTRFHIDYDWWTHSDRDWRIYLQSLLCSEHQEAFADYDNGETVDWVDPTTAEIQQVDGLQHILISHCSKEEGFVSQRTALVDAVFRVFVANGNEPMTVVEIGEKLGRPPEIILRTLSGRQVYRGVRPIYER